MASKFDLLGNSPRKVLPGDVTLDWQTWGNYHDIYLDKTSIGIARVAINRPEKRNAFRPRTVFELCDAFTRIRDNKNIGVVLFTGVGPASDGGYAFCSGGDQSVRGDGGYLDDDGYFDEDVRYETNMELLEFFNQHLN